MSQRMNASLLGAVCGSRRRLTAIICCCWTVACGSSERSTAPNALPTVTLSATPNHLTDAGGITLAAVATAGTVRKVEFYQRHVGIDTMAIVASDSVPPY